VKPGHIGLRRAWMATRYTARGLAAAWRHEAAFRQECMAAVVLVPAAFWLGTSAAEVALLLGTCGLVLAVELLTAIETLVDRVTAVPDALARRAKDLGSAAVGLSLLTLAAVWLTLAWHRFT
jgi:diacylglycerol kinase (ATP)